jgi:hypothetical protein
MEYPNSMHIWLLLKMFFYPNLPCIEITQQTSIYTVRIKREKDQQQKSNYEGKINKNHHWCVFVLFLLMHILVWFTLGREIQFRPLVPMNFCENTFKNIRNIKINFVLHRDVLCLHGIRKNKIICVPCKEDKF